jgi:membrane-bound serine protease (ClpP class)
MAPGTNTGAAHPVAPGQDSKTDEIMKKKMESDVAAFARSIAQERGRNVEWAEKAVINSISATDKEALKLGVIDLIAKDTEELIKKLDGMEIKSTKEKKILKWDNIEVVRLEPNFREKVLLILGDPNIAYILMMIGLVGLYFELAHPGSFFPGTMGAISLLLALYALHTLSANLTGILLICFAGILLILELFVTSYGILGISGLVSLIIGSMMLFEAPYTGVSISRDVLWSTLGITSAFFFIILYLASRAIFSRPRSGTEGLVGERGVVKKKVGPRGGKVFIHGEIWNAFSDDEIPEGTEVEITAVHGLKIKIKKTEQGGLI